MTRKRSGSSPSLCVSTSPRSRRYSWTIRRSNGGSGSSSTGSPSAQRLLGGVVGLGAQRLGAALAVAVGVDHDPHRRGPFGKDDPLREVLHRVDRLPVAADEQPDVLARRGARSARRRPPRPRPRRRARGRRRSPRAAPRAPRPARAPRGEAPRRRSRRRRSSPPPRALLLLARRRRWRRARPRRPADRRRPRRRGARPCGAAASAAARACRSASRQRSRRSRPGRRLARRGGGGPM